MSKGDILRGFVSERLAVATQDILGVVDRIVAGWEEEASGFRREIERQRRQLEVLLQQPFTQGRKCRICFVLFYSVKIKSSIDKNASFSIGACRTL